MMQPETYAQWKNGKPVNERLKSQIRIPNTNHQAHRMTPEQLAERGWYRVLRIELGEGERLDNESWNLGNHSITQIGTIIDAETVAAQEQQAQKQAMKEQALSIPDNVMAAYIDFRLAISNAAHLATELGMTVADDISYQGLDAALQTLIEEAPDAADWQAIAANIERKWNRVVAMTGRTLGEAYAMIPLLDLRMELNKEQP